MSLRGGSGGRFRTASIVSTTLSPPNGARPVKQRVQHGAQAVDVAGGGHGAAAAAGLLGRHVRRRAEDRPGLGELDVGLDLLRQPEVGDVRMALVVDQDVGRLEVAVQDAAGVGVGHRLGRLGHQAGGGPRVVLVAAQQRHEAAAGDQLHAEVVLAVVLADLVDRHDARVVEQGDGLGLVAGTGAARRRRPAGRP